MTKERSLLKLLALLLTIAVCIVMLLEIVYAAEGAAEPDPKEPMSTLQVETAETADVPSIEAPQASSTDPQTTIAPVGSTPAAQGEGTTTTDMPSEATPTAVPQTPTDLATLQTAATTAIDALPDTTAEDFAVTAENAAEYNTLLLDAKTMIEAYLAAGGDETQLDTGRYGAFATAFLDYARAVAQAAIDALPNPTAEGSAVTAENAEAYRALLKNAKTAIDIYIEAGDEETPLLDTTGYDVLAKAVAAYNGSVATSASPTPTASLTPADLAVLQATAQAAIDALPDPAAEGSAVTAENIEAYKALLTNAKTAIDAYTATGGETAQLDTIGYNALAGVVAAYESSVVPASPTPSTTPSATPPAIPIELMHLQIAAQEAIDALPNPAAEGFAVTAENAAEYKALLDAARTAIDAYTADGGSETLRDADKYDALSAALTDYVRIAVQKVIDELPDTTEKDFAVTAKNLEEYKTLLDEADQLIAGYVAAGGEEAKLDKTKFDALSDALSAYDGGKDATRLAAILEAVQKAIDELPDTTEKDFAVTAKNLEEYKTLLDEADQLIAGYVAAGGEEAKLDKTKFDALSDALSAYDGGKDEARLAAILEALQKVIDKLPDTTEEGFAVTAENLEEYTAHLDYAGQLIEGYVAEGGEEAKLDKTKFDALSDALSAYNGGGTDAGNSELLTAAQAAIDALPDPAAEGFAVTERNAAIYKEQLDSAKTAIDAYLAAGGDETLLRAGKYDALFEAFYTDNALLAAQAVIDDLPDTTLEDFAVTEENLGEYKAQLDYADEVIAAYLAAGGDEMLLSMWRYEALLDALSPFIYSADAVAMEAFRARLQRAIDTLPDATAEDFAVTEENFDAYDDRQQRVSKLIGAYLAAGGEESQLNMQRYEDFAAAVAEYSAKSGGGQMMLMSMSGEDQWLAIESDFTVDAIQTFIPDRNFAQAVYDSISFGIQMDEYHIDKESILDPENYNDDWPEPITVEEIIDSGATGSDLVEALLRNYAGPINAYSRGITSIVGFEVLKNTTSIDFQKNRITDLTSFCGPKVVGGTYNFNSNPICKWPETFPNTVRSATHSVPTAFTVINTPLKYLFGDISEPELYYEVYYPNATTVNTNWYYKWWSRTEAYNPDPNVVPSAPTQYVGTIPLPQLQYEGNCVLEIGLTGTKTGEDLVNNLSNAISYISGMTIRDEKEGGGVTGGTTGQGNSPSYRFGVTIQRYAKVTIEDNTKIKGGFAFTKKSAAAGGRPLAGAEYSLYTDANCTVPAEDDQGVAYAYTTDQSGMIKAGDLEPGTYYLKETKAPVGYALNEEAEDVVTIVISDPGFEATKTVTGGVTSFDRDVLAPELTAAFGGDPNTNGIWTKSEAPTTVTAASLSADALLTNKGNVGFKKLTALSINQPESYNETYVKEADSIEIEVFMGGVKVGPTYTSDADAIAGINSILNSKTLTGDLHIVYGADFQATEEGYTDGGEQTDKPLPVNLDLAATKSLMEGEETVELAANQFKFLLSQTGSPDGVDYLITEGTSMIGYNETSGLVVFPNSLVFAEPGRYTFQLSEDKTYRNPALLPEGDYYDGITYDETVRQIVVDVTWPDSPETDGNGSTVVFTVTPGMNDEDSTSFGEYYGIQEDGTQGTNTVDENGTITAAPIEVVTAEFENVRSTDYSLKVLKNNVAGDLLQGAGFLVYSDLECTTLATVYSDSEKTTLIADTEEGLLRTNADGELLFYGLERETTYYVKESYAPTGYGLQQVVKIAIDADGNITVADIPIVLEEGSSEIGITVTDNVLVLDLPESGGVGAMPFAAAGMLLMLAACIAATVIRKRNRRKGKRCA